MDFKSKSNLTVRVYVKDHSGSMKNNTWDMGRSGSRGTSWEAVAVLGELMVAGVSRGRGVKWTKSRSVGT